MVPVLRRQALGSSAPLRDEVGPATETLAAAWSDV